MKKIECLRQKLYDSLESDNFKEILKASQDLDKEILTYAKESLCNIWENDVLNAQNEE